MINVLVALKYDQACNAAKDPSDTTISMQHILHADTDGNGCKNQGVDTKILGTCNDTLFAVCHVPPHRSGDFRQAIVGYANRSFQRNPHLKAVTATKIKGDFRECNLCDRKEPTHCTKSATCSLRTAAGLMKKLPYPTSTHE